jgi:hypothetical protein
MSERTIKNIQKESNNNNHPPEGLSHPRKNR